MEAPAPHLVVSRAPTSRRSAPAVPLPCTVRARLWVAGRTLRPPDDQARLWLHLSDGRVLAFRLPAVPLGEDGVIAPLVAEVTNDLRGNRWALEHPAFGFAQVLYAAPVLPLLRREHAGFVFDAEFQQFAAGLDGEVMRLLLSLERDPTPAAVTRRDGEAPHPLPARFYASIRNYNRLATLPPELRERRMQALARFPALVAPILLTAHHSPNCFDGKRHAWREKDEAVEAAIDAGKDLIGALARHYGISKGLVRAPVNAAMWPAPDQAYRRSRLELLDALPDNQRPGLAEFERWQLYLANYFALLGEHDRDHPLPYPPEVHRGAFRLGWSRTWETAARRFGDLHPALADCRDFLRAARERAAVILRRPDGPGVGRLAAAWLACHGLLGLLAASDRWHRQRPGIAHADRPAGFRLPAILGEVNDNGRAARELTTPQELAEEGEAMHHCVASYWDTCVGGDRIFALRLADGERATAQYHPTLRGDVGDDIRYRLVQLRGPCNEDASAAMEAWARAIEAQLNAPERRNARRVALEARGRLEEAQWQARQALRLADVWLDAKSERQLRRVLAWLGQQPPAPEVLLSAPIAGYQYHAEPQLQDRLAAGQPLTLVREPDNPHDGLAVRLDWQGHKLGYVPRPENVEIARRLDAGERLTANVANIDRQAEPWERVAFVIQAMPN